VCGDRGHVAARRAVAVDGKERKGAKAGGNKKVHLLAAVTHVPGLVIAQDKVAKAGKANEISHFKPLLAPLPLEGVLVTSDALCRRRHKASYADQVVMPMPSSGAVLVAMAGRTTVGIITGTRGTPRERPGAGSVRPWNRAAPCGRALFP
jgi:hypothetical protein